MYSGCDFQALLISFPRLFFLCQLLLQFCNPALQYNIFIAQTPHPLGPILQSPLWRFIHVHAKTTSIPQALIFITAGTMLLVKLIALLAVVWQIITLPSHELSHYSSISFHKVFHASSAVWGTIHISPPPTYHPSEALP